VTSFIDFFEDYEAEVKKMVPGILQTAACITSALSKLDASAVSSLCSVLKDNSCAPISRRYVMQKLCELKGEFSEKLLTRIRDSLVRILVDEDSEIRVASAKALAEMGEDHWQEYIKGKDEDAVYLARTGDMRILEMLLCQLKESSYLKPELKEAMLSFGPAVIDPLLELLRKQKKDNYSGDFVNSACQILSHFREPRMFETLVYIIESFPDSRGPAAKVLADLRDPRCIQLLRESILTHGLAYSRKVNGCSLDNMILPLSKLGTSSTAVLIELLAHDNAEIREQAALALEKVADPRAVKPLMRALDDPARFLSLDIPLFSWWAFGVDSNFVAEASAKALEAILRTCPEKLSENNLQLLACLPHKQKTKERLVDDVVDVSFATFYRSYEKVTFRVEDRCGIDCREIRLLASLELSERQRARLRRALA